MSKTVSIGIAVAIVALLHLMGGFKAVNLAHAFWADKATVVGVVLGIALFLAANWLGKRMPDLLRWLKILLGAGFLVALIATSYAAQYFINASEYEPFAGKIWFFGYHATLALFIAMLTTVLTKRWGI